MDGAALLPEFDQEMANTRKVLERVPDDRFDFRPHERSWTLRELAAHVSNLPSWGKMTLETTEIDLDAPFERPDPKSTEDLLSWFDEHVTATREAIRGATAEDLGVPWSLRSSEKVWFTMPRSSVYRFFMMNHLIHHRGQLGVYLRLLDVPVPGMYGPSGDEKM